MLTAKFKFQINKITYIFQMLYKNSVVCTLTNAHLYLYVNNKLKKKFKKQKTKKSNMNLSKLY